MPGVSVDRRIAAVVIAGNCSGCGACCLLDSGLEMQLNDNGYARPVRVGPSGPAAAQARFERICPGVVVHAVRPERAVRDDSLGSAHESWQAWATDPQTRFLGSSGGALTAIVRWLLETGQVGEVVEATRAESDPSRTVSVTISTPSGALAAAGSRYAPVSNAALAVIGRPDSAFVGKPCEVAAIRALALQTGQPAPLLLSFFCAGTPSQAATQGLADRLSGGEPITDLWYRGHGWPGSFTVTLVDGSRVSASYDQSWGRDLGPTTQWRCKICPDGVGESADIVAADYWESDSDGYPVFDEAEGVSALIARTERGHTIIRNAFEAGVIGGESLELSALAKVQPLQVERRRTLLARMIGARLAGRAVPRYRGFDLGRLSPRAPREFARIVMGTYRRVRGGRARG